ncbi:MAG: Flp pilus assembly protein CpaB [Bryobacteraceae bacterium]|jgi:pilus assembly protein CpaB
MNKRFAYVLVFALIVAALATLLFYRLVAGRLSSEPAPVTAQVFAAARTLPVGTLIRDVDVKMTPWAGPIPPDSILKKEDLIGRGVIATIYQDEPILEPRLAARGAGAGMAATIPPGMRAVAVRVNEIIGVAGFVLPGQRVDVLISGMAPGASQSLGMVTRTLLQSIEVLSAGHNIQRDAEGKPISVPVVNLLVTPEQAETLSLASSEMKIQLVLRNPLDTETVKTPGTAVGNLFSGQRLAGLGEERRPAGRRKPVVVEAVKERPEVVVEVIQGGKRDTARFKEAEQ